MIKILVVNSNYSKNIDGIGNVIKNYYYAINKSDLLIDFTFMVLPDDCFVNDIKNNNGKVFLMPNKSRAPFSYITKLLKILKQGKYDSIHVHGSSALLAVEMVCARLTGVKQRIAHSHSTSCKHKLLNRMLSGIFKANVTKALACGQEAGEWMFKSKPFTILNNAVNYQKFAYNEEIRLEYRKKHNLDDKIVIGHIGMFNEVKNHIFLIKVFDEIIKINKNYHLVLIGGGRLKNDMQGLVNSLKLTSNVTFMGESKEVPQLLQMIDIIVMPSLYEGFPLVLVEAQCASIPCFLSDRISSKVDLIKRAIFLSIDLDPKEWANEILNYEITDRNIIKDESREMIIKAGYDLESEAEKLVKIYKESLQ